MDSFDVLPALLGRSTTARHFVIEEASVVVSEKSSLGEGGGSILALIEDNWKLIQASEAPAEYHGNDLGNGPAVLLYDLARDPGERTDLASIHPARAATMLTRLRVGRCRSNPASLMIGEPPRRSTDCRDCSHEFQMISADPRIAPRKR